MLTNTHQNILNQRSEIIFLYDIKDANPNGDPLDENKPRIDPENEINIVTDVRLKRTIRDYILNYKNKTYDIFIKEIEYEPGKIQDAKMRIEDFLVDDNGNKIKKESLNLETMKEIMTKNVLARCIDVRLFGATIPVEKDDRNKTSITFTGPVQFRFGRSLHPVEEVYIKGTGAFASSEGREQKTFREEYILPYSLICFYGVINENAAKNTNLTEEDIKIFLEAMWLGTKNLISRSKFGHMPRFLLRIVYQENNYHIGDLDKEIFLIDRTNHQPIINGKSLRSIKDFEIDIGSLIAKLEKNKEKISCIEFEVNEDVNFFYNQTTKKGLEIKQVFKTLVGNDESKIINLGFES